jgi:hypothetical protein
MDGEWNHGQMAQNTKVNMLMGKKMGEANLLLQMVLSTMANLKKMKLVVEGNITGQTVNITKDNGRETKCTVMVYWHGVMESGTRVNLLMTRGMDKELLLGQTADNT